MTNPANPYHQYEAPLVIAHRGGGGIAPENSCDAFDMAAALPDVHALETDVHMTKDGVIVVSHDPDVDRMADGKGMIRDMTLAELQSLDMGYQFSEDGESYPFRGKGCRYMTLEEMITRYPQHIINIDIKQHDTVVVDQFVALMQKHDMQQRIVVGSFDEATVKRVRQLMPGVATCATYREVLSFFLLNKVGLAGRWRHGCVAMQIPEKEGRLTVITPSFIKNLQVHGVQVHVWTVNETRDMQRLLGWGVDGLITDFPERAIETVNAYKVRSAG